MVSPEGEGQLEILLWTEGVAVIRGVKGSDSWVRPEDASVAIPGVSLMPWEDSVAPLLSALLSQSIWSICGPQLDSGVSPLVALWGFGEDLNDDVFVRCLVEDVEVAIPTRRLGANEPGTCFDAEDRQDGRLGVVSGVASIDRRLMATLRVQATRGEAQWRSGVRLKWGTWQRLMRGLAL
jgi:hypothetical protein